VSQKHRYVKFRTQPIRATQEEYEAFLARGEDWDWDKYCHVEAGPEPFVLSCVGPCPGSREICVAKDFVDPTTGEDIFWCQCVVPEDTGFT